MTILKLKPFEDAMEISFQKYKEFSGPPAPQGFSQDELLACSITHKDAQTDLRSILSGIEKEFRAALTNYGAAGHLALDGLFNGYSTGSAADGDIMVATAGDQAWFNGQVASAMLSFRNSLLSAHAGGVIKLKSFGSTHPHLRHHVLAANKEIGLHRANTEAVAYTHEQALKSIALAWVEKQQDDGWFGNVFKRFLKTTDEFFSHLAEKADREIARIEALMKAAYQAINGSIHVDASQAKAAGAPYDKNFPRAEIRKAWQDIERNHPADVALLKTQAQNPLAPIDERTHAAMSRVAGHLKGLATHVEQHVAKVNKANGSAPQIFFGIGLGVSISLSLAFGGSVSAGFIYGLDSNDKAVTLGYLNYAWSIGTAVAVAADVVVPILFVPIDQISGPGCDITFAGGEIWDLELQLGFAKDFGGLQSVVPGFGVGGGLTPVSVTGGLGYTLVTEHQDLPDMPPRG